MTPRRGRFIFRPRNKSDGVVVGAIIAAARVYTLYVQTRRTCFGQAKINGFVGGRAEYMSRSKPTPADRVQIKSLGEREVEWRPVLLLVKLIRIATATPWPQSSGLSHVTNPPPSRVESLSSSFGRRR